MTKSLSKEQKIAALQHACKTNLRFLCKNVLGMSEWEDSLHNDLAAFLEKSGNRKLVLMPRGHLKSSIVTVGWAIQQLLKNPNLRILISNATWNKSREFLNQIGSYLTTGSLPAIFGSFQSPAKRWTIEDIEIAQKTDLTKRGPSIATAGLERSLNGLHADLIIHDDLVDEKNSITAEQIEKVKAFYRQSLPVLDPGGRIVVIGTRWTMGDLYSELIETQMSSLNGQIVPQERRLNWREYLVRTK